MKSEKSESGFIYIMTSSTDDRSRGVKIGKTLRSPFNRAKELTTTGVYIPFEVKHYWEVPRDELDLIEKDLHSILDKYRIKKNREFFKLSIARAKEKIDEYLDRKSLISKLREEYEADDSRRAESKKEREEIFKNLKDLGDYLENELGKYNFYLCSHTAEKAARNKLVSIYKVPEKRALSAEIKGYSTFRRRQRPITIEGGSYPDWRIYIVIGARLKATFFSSEASYEVLNIHYHLFTGETEYGKKSAIEFGYPANLSGLLNRPEFASFAKYWEENVLMKFNFKKEYKETFVREVLKEHALCPRCKTGTLVVRHRRSDNHPFLGCDNYPKCKYTTNFVDD